jgi:hypothetical protein
MDGFSVIMPTYNQGSFIRRAIKSLCDQIYKTVDDLVLQLKDKELIDQLSHNMLTHRHQFTWELFFFLLLC